jgi:HEAT repeat protein
MILRRIKNGIIVFMLFVGVAMAKAQTSIPKEEIPEYINKKVKDAILMLYSKKSDERAFGALYLGEGGSLSEPAIPFLIDLLNDAAEIYRNQLTSFGQNVFHQYVSSNSFSPSEVASNALVKIGVASIEPLIASLEKLRVDTRWYAAKALIKFGQQAGAPLINALQHRHFQARWMAVYALGRIKDERAFEPLIAALKDENAFVKREVIETLERFKDNRAVEPIINELENMLEDNSLLADNRLAEGSGTTTTTMAELNLEVRKEAMFALGEFKDKRAVEPLSNALNNPIPEIRFAAACALAEFDDTRAVEHLIEALKRKDVLGSREVAAKHLGRLKDIRAVEPLIYALNDRDRDVKIEAIISLQNIGDLRSVEPLVNALNDKDKYVIEKVQGALEKIGKAAIEPLIEALKNKNSTIRNNAASTLNKITKNNFGNKYDIWHKWWEENKDIFLDKTE